VKNIFNSNYLLLVTLIQYLSLTPRLRRIDMKTHHVADSEGPKGNRLCTHNLRSSTGTKCKYVVCLAIVNFSVAKTLQ